MNLSSLLANALMQGNRGQLTDESGGYNTGSGLSSTYGGPQGSLNRRVADLKALREKYNQAVSDGDFDTADQLYAVIQQITQPQQQQGGGGL